MKRKIRFFHKAVLPVAVAAAIAFPTQTFTFISYAAEAEGPGPAEEEEESEYDDATLARLADNVLEYDEIPDLIHKYNSDIQESWDSFNEDKTNAAKIQTELLSQARYMKEQKESASREGEDEDAQYYAQQEQAYKSMAKRYTDTLEDYDKPKATKALKRQERSLTKAAQTLMISYNTMRLQRENQAKMKEVYEAKARLAQLKVQAGTGTALEAQNAENMVLSAESALLSLDSSMAELKASLCVMTGWAADANPDIREIPTSDPSVIDTWNLEEDTVKAIGNNQTLISQRTGNSSKSSSQITNHLRVVEQGEQQLTIKMQSLYQDAVDKRNLYEAALAGFQSASIAKSAADQKYRSGMISESEYLEEELTWLQKKASKESADMNLFSAISAYEWAVAGFTEIE